MSGGIHQIFELETVDKDEFWNILSATKHGCVASCSIFVGNKFYRFILLVCT